VFRKWANNSSTSSTRNCFTIHLVGSCCFRRGRHISESIRNQSDIYKGRQAENIEYNCSFVLVQRHIELQKPANKSSMSLSALYLRHIALHLVLPLSSIRRFIAILDRLEAFKGWHWTNIVHRMKRDTYRHPSNIQLHRIHFGRSFLTNSALMSAEQTKFASQCAVQSTQVFSCRAPMCKSTRKEFDWRVEFGFKDLSSQPGLRRKSTVVYIEDILSAAGEIDFNLLHGPMERRKKMNHRFTRSILYGECNRQDDENPCDSVHSHRQRHFDVEASTIYKHLVDRSCNTLNYSSNICGSVFAKLLRSSRSSTRFMKHCEGEVVFGAGIFIVVLLSRLDLLTSGRMLKMPAQIALLNFELF